MLIDAAAARCLPEPCQLLHPKGDMDVLGRELTEVLTELALVVGECDTYMVTGDGWNGARGYCAGGVDRHVHRMHVGGRYFCRRETDAGPIVRE